VKVDLARCGGIPASAELCTERLKAKLKGEEEDVEPSPPHDAILSRGGVTLTNPLELPDWDRLVEARGDATVFHTSGWAKVLRETYGHRPFYFSRIRGGKLEQLLPIMEVSSRWTGKRGVGLPFTDFCPPLQGEPGSRGIFDEAMRVGRERGWRYLEYRGDLYTAPKVNDGRGRPSNRQARTPALQQPQTPLASRIVDWQGTSASVSFYGHVVDLSRDEGALFRSLEGAARRGVRKAEQNKVEVDFSTSAEAIRTYFELHCRTRRRLGVPPQPVRFFENIARFVLSPGDGFVAVARHQDRPIAAAVFFLFGRQAIYKFGAWDSAFQHVRGNSLVMWTAIKRLAGDGFTSLHLGRTSLGDEGLRRFKLGFGAREERINYFRYDFRKSSFVSAVDRSESWANRIFRLMPAPLLRFAGSVLYPHLS
jgi:hypothetical protein